LIRYYHLLRNISNWWLHFQIKWNLTSDDPVIFRSRNRVAVAVPRRILHEFKEVFLENAYFSGLRRRLGPSPVIIDIGANVGFFSLLAASKDPTGTIYAFEPIPNNFAQLEANRRLNPHVGLRCFQEAVCGHAGRVEMVYDGSDSYSTIASVLTTMPPDDYPDTITVPCTTLPRIFERFGLTRCDLLKLDCEGAEHDLLYHCPGPVLDRIDQIAVEVHNGDRPGHNLDAMKRFLAEHGLASHQDEKTPHMLYAYRP
jgi:FkbM family methyltransferase